MIKSDLLRMKTCVGNVLFLFIGEHFIWDLLKIIGKILKNYR